MRKDLDFVRETNILRQVVFQELYSRALSSFNSAPYYLKKGVYLDLIDGLMDECLIVDIYDADTYSSSDSLVQKSPIDFVVEQYGLRSSDDLLRFVKGASFTNPKDDSLVIYFMKKSDYRFPGDLNISHIGFVEDGFAVTKLDIYSPAIVHHPSTAPAFYGDFFAFVNSPKKF